VRHAADRIARTLGNALVAHRHLRPEGAVDPPSGHMLPGTITLPRLLHEDLGTRRGASRPRFTDIVFLGDSGGNQRA
jgi:hypothetical protein